MQIVAAYLPAVTEGEGALEHILQFAHVTREGVTAHGLQRLGMQLWRAGLIGLRDALQQRCGQGRYIAFALAQARHPQFDDIDSKKQVFAKAPAAHFLCQGLVRCGQESDIGSDFLVGAHRSHALFLNGAQEFDLHGQGQVGDFVQKQGPALRGREQAQLVATRAGKTAFQVPEEFALDQLGGDRSAVDGDERARRAGSAAVDTARDDFLAAAGFPMDVHGGLTACELVDLRAQFAHRLRVADQFATAGIAWRRPQLQGGIDQIAQLFERHRLADKVEGARLEGANGAVHIAVGRNHGHRQPGMMPLYVLDQLDAAAIGQTHIGQTQAQGGLAIQHGAGFGHVRRGHGFQPHAPQGNFQQLANIGLVIDDQHAGGGIGIHGAHGSCCPIVI